KANEQIAAYPGFAELHPLLPQLPGGEVLVQGALEVLYETARLLCEICGMSAFTMQPLAGAHGELTGTMIMAAYHKNRGNRKKRILIPDSAHGTNPASAAIAGYGVQTIPSDEGGDMSYDALADAVDDEVAGLMLTCPNTLGLFNPHLAEICERIHDVDGLVYCDGANLNAMLGRCRPGDVGFDIVHVNLHETFATPHGGGGPGAGPVGVCERLVDFLPASIIRKQPDGSYSLDYDLAKTIGYIAPFYGNFGIIVRAYAYLLMLGREGLLRVSENAVLNANYIRHKLKDHYDLPHPQLCKHECVFSASRQTADGVHALDIAKALIDRGFHPPTMYFPLTVHEALMIEPTETESIETLDAFIDAMLQIERETRESPDLLHDAPHHAPVGRLDEVAAVKNLNVRWTPDSAGEGAG
ncbi:MAG: aminomethyl-transferring glycine dehydrogenase subunit GcvPB, partial [Candidatus Brocadiae bacterium]|nr:aminomethyl-transferring glycine dehydrogenase subunit GcvPB [Candidatus Brocadiia bacterium]